MAFTVNQRVVCIDDRDMGSIRNPLVKGEIYTIASLFDHRGETGILLKEIQPPGPRCVGFVTSMFRPLVSTNIDIFNSILANPHRELETVE